MDKIIFKKIPIEDLLNILADIWEEGARYVDIQGVSKRNRDDLIISTNDEYFINNNEDVIPPKLTDNDINQLI